MKRSLAASESSALEIHARTSDPIRIRSVGLVARSRDGVLWLKRSLAGTRTAKQGSEYGVFCRAGYIARSSRRPPGNICIGGLRSKNRNVMRVEPEDYRANLDHIGEQCELLGIAVWYFTAPHAFDRGIPPYLIQSGEIADEQSLIPLHQSYNPTVREVANARAAC